MRPVSHVPTDSTDIRVHEVKFLLDEGAADRVEALARREIGAGKDLVTTLLFLDTPRLDSLRREGDLKRDRYRVRRDGESGIATLERKTRKKYGSRVRTVAVPLAEVGRLAEADGDPSWPGSPFHVRVLEFGLGPVCRATYARRAFAGASPDGDVRLAFDRRLVAAGDRAWSLAPVAEGPDLLAGRVLVEARLSGAMPAWLRALVRDMGLEPASFSKYRRAAEAAGLLPEGLA